ncbi:NRAMP family divalent metal transporter [Alteraurantiacibacter palmitatis]|uniref:NRAMP family divalent metal transporter n=1 Tax=Alteraurantiacibacter palmitatis TaxID=2054628 RepID=A0ABV7E575_9SPHN
MPPLIDQDGSAAQPPSWRARLGRLMGPGLITGAADDDPSGIATYSQAGAQFGFGIGWTMLFTYPLMAAIQMISARIGRTTGQGIAANLRQHYSRWLVVVAVLLLLVANTVNIGADLGAMADATALVFGGPSLAYLILYAAFCVVAQTLIPFRRYIQVLKWLTLALLAYVATLFIVSVPWATALRDLLLPQISWDVEYFAIIVAVFGTTISPYLFFWQASEEAEEASPSAGGEALADPAEMGDAEIARIRFDTLGGMGLSNLVALAIIFTAAATLNPAGITNIQTSADAAEALRPLAGELASLIFALGIVGTGLLAVPVLAGSAAYALGEAFGWPVGLSRKPAAAKAFYGTILVATVVGIAITFAPVQPIAALYWAAVLNGVVAVPVMAVMMLICVRPDIMGRFAVRGPLRWAGWLATAMMALAVAGMAVTSL